MAVAEGGARGDSLDYHRMVSRLAPEPARAHAKCIAGLEIAVAGSKGERSQNRKALLIWLWIMIPLVLMLTVNLPHLQRLFR
jgi:hypothetical protein